MVKSEGGIICCGWETQTGEPGDPIGDEITSLSEVLEAPGMLV